MGHRHWEDGRAEIPLPLIEERDGASFQFQHLFLLTKDYCAIPNLLPKKNKMFFFLSLKRTKYEYIMSTRRHHHLSIKSKTHSIVL